MFVEIALGRTGDAGGIRRQWERWHDELAAGAAGWTGSTGGVTGDGRVVLLTRFHTADAARANSARPDQQAWWSDTEALLEGDPELLGTTT